LAQPIYLDELSLSKFIEDYLEYQVDFAVRELNSIRGDSQNVELSEQRPVSNAQPQQSNTSKDELLSRQSDERIDAAKNSLAAKFIAQVNDPVGGQLDVKKSLSEPAASIPVRSLSNQRFKITSSIPVINELVMILEVERLLFKSFNLLVAQSIKKEAKKISNFFQEQRSTQDLLHEKFPKTYQWQTESQVLELFMTYVKESLKYILFSFFKRCRIIVKILD